jgi:hypothetical protein
MIPLGRCPKSVLVLLASGLAVVSPTATRADDGEIAAVSSKVSDDYVRTKRADGKYEPEDYAFGEGGVWGGAAKDNTIEKLSFLDVARTIAVPLAGENYLPARDPRQTRLLIMVYWGTTAGTRGNGTSDVATQNLAGSQSLTAPTLVQLPNGRTINPGGGGDPRKSAQTMDESLVFALSVQNHLRDQADFKNARLLGYDDAMLNARGYESTALRSRRDDLLEEIGESRYFVVLMAYDFQLLWKEKKHKLLWETRFSIREHRNDFSKNLAGMAFSAARYFGQDSHGLVRKRVREGTVEIGETKFLDYEPEKK